jgi:Flp pilus assembly protein TadD
MEEAKALYKEGFQHFIAGNYDQAVALYREASSIDPELAIAWNGLAMSLDRLGDMDGALDAGKMLVKLEPNEPLGHTSLSIFYQKKGMIPEAEEEKALAMQLTMAMQEN